MSNQAMKEYFASKTTEAKRLTSTFLKTLRKVGKDETMSFEAQEDLSSMVVTLTAFALVGAGLEIEEMGKLVESLMKAQMLITMYGDKVCDASDILSLVNELEELLK